LRGNVRKSVKIISNDEANAEFPLTLAGDILQVLECTPQVINLRGLAGNRLTGRAVLKKGSWLDYEILEYGLKFKNANIDSFEPTSDGESIAVSFSAEPVDRPMIFNEELQVKVRTSDEKERDLSFRFRVEHNARVLASPRGQLKFLPAKVETLRDPEAKPIQMPISLTVGGPEVEFHVLDVKLDENLEGVFRTETIVQTAGKRYLVKVWLDKWQPKRQVIGKLTVVTDDPDNKEISLWVMAVFTNRQPSKG